MKEIYRQIKTLEKAASGTIPAAFVERRDGLWAVQIPIVRQSGHQTKMSLHGTLDEAMAHIHTEAKKNHCKDDFPVIIDDIPEGIENGF